MTISLYIIFVLAGLAIGSFLNVCIDRLPARKSIVSPPSHCDSCGKTLTALDNIPILSYLWLRGRCRYCGAHIPIRVLLVEALTGLMVGLAFWRYGLSAQFGITVFWCCIFLLIIFIDLEHQLILNKITYPAAVVAILILAADTFFPHAGVLGPDIPSYRLNDVFGAFNNTSNIPLRFIPQPSIFSGLLAGAICFVFFFIVFLINQRGLGMGDIKMVTLMGLATGFPLGMFALFIGIFVGGIAAVILLLARKKGRKDVMPYGVFLGIGPIVALLWGNGIIAWYWGFFQR